jgi:hypothetical protein
MNRIKTYAVAVLFLLFCALAWSQEPRDESKSRQEPRQEEARPEASHDKAAPPRQNEARPPQQDEARPPKSERQEEARPPRDEANPSHQQREEQPAQGQAARSGQHARPSGKSAHIPDAKFKASFGRQHTFKASQVLNTTTVVAGQTQFVYVGYTFVILDPWPAEWLFTDDLYIDYMDDDYFLFDPFHPGIRVALFVEG